MGHPLGHQGTMILYFLSQGDAIQDPQIRDSERQLSDFGQQQATTVGRFLRASKKRIEHILCSPLLKAQQTAAAVLQEIEPIPLYTTEHLTSSSDPRHILRELSDLNRETALLNRT